ncbi:MAG: SMI1/KNR4 family protein [Alphaproteobacteria bacterium]|nr:MAG: SMI1/KNR4 family protein [Alphaproteobacteria bacterium]
MTNIRNVTARLVELSGRNILANAKVTEGQVRNFESQVGIELPDDYKYFLKEVGSVIYSTLEPAIISDEKVYYSLKNIMNEGHQVGVPELLIPFCCDNGDYYCFTKDGKVVFWSHNGLTSESWPSFASWIEQVWIGESLAD